MSASDVSSVPIVTNQSHPSSQIRACPDPEPSAAPSRARRASAASTSAAPASKRSRRAAKKESKNRVPQAAARFDAHFPPHYRYSHDDHQALDVFGAWQRSIGTRELTLVRAESTTSSARCSAARSLAQPSWAGPRARAFRPGRQKTLATTTSSTPRRQRAASRSSWRRAGLAASCLPRWGCASTCRLALRCGIRWAWPTMAMPLRPVSTCTTRATRRRWTSDKWSTR